MPKKRKTDLPPLKLGKETVGKRIARIRKNRGLTQIQLAEKIGITQSIISDYEIGRLHLNDEMVVRFALALNVSSDEILGLKNGDSGSAAPSLKIIRRLKKIEELPENDQKALLKTIDLVINSKK